MNLRRRALAIAVSAIAVALVGPGVVPASPSAPAFTAKAVEPDQFGNRERRYLDELRPILYRRYPSNIVSYGLKVFPVRAARPGGSLEWLRDY